MKEETGRFSASGSPRCPDQFKGCEATLKFTKVKEVLVVTSIDRHYDASNFDADEINQINDHICTAAAICHECDSFDIHELSEEAVEQ